MDEAKLELFYNSMNTHADICADKYSGNRESAIDSAIVSIMRGVQYLVEKSREEDNNGTTYDRLFERA